MPKRRKLGSDDFPNMHANHRGRMRKRVRQSGAASLEPYELLEMLLYIPIARQNTNFTAHMLVESFGSAEQVLRRRPEELTRIQGVGEQSAEFLRDVGRVVEAYARARRRGRTVLSDSLAAQRLAEEFFAGNPDEDCVLFSLDESLRLLATSALPRNPTTQDLIRTAIKFRADCAVIALRDGGGDENPLHSEQETFGALTAVFSLLGIRFVDFLIIGGSESRSRLAQMSVAANVCYGEEREFHESSLHFAGGRKPLRFEDGIPDEPDADESYDTEIDPEEIYETVVEPLGTVEQIRDTETVGDAAPFADLLTDAEADEEPF